MRAGSRLTPPRSSLAAHNQDVPTLASMVHGLRRSRGNALKIVVRELGTSLRYSDERLLLAWR